MGIKILVHNKKASHDYFLEEKFEAGMVLQGTEVKSLRDGKCSITESFVSVDKNHEVWLQNMHIPQYKFGTYDNHAENRKRKLLLHAEEIARIEKSLATKGQTLVPVKVYFKNSLVKVEIALAKGKKLYDKRQDAAKKDIERKLRQGNYE